MELTTLALATVAGVVAGVLTTASGLGGGLLITGLLGLKLGPDVAVAVTAPVLFVGSGARFVMFRRETDWGVPAPFLLGAVPSVVLVAVLLPRLPAELLRTVVALALLVYIAVAATGMARATGRTELRRGWFAVSGVLAGALSATVGGGTPASAPFFERHGLTRGAFAATNGLCHAALHLAKVVVFAGSQLLSASALPLVASASLGILVGTRLGKVVLGHLSATVFRTLLLLVLLGIALMYLLDR